MLTSSSGSDINDLAKNTMKSTFFYYVCFHLFFQGCISWKPNVVQRYIDRKSPINGRLYPSGSHLPSNYVREQFENFRDFIEESVTYFPVIKADADSINYLDVNLRKQTSDKSGAVIWLRRLDDAEVGRKSIVDRCKQPSLVVFFHGNRLDFFNQESKDGFDLFFKSFDYLGSNIVYVEYPGYGLLQNDKGWGRHGTPLNTVEAARAALRHLTNDKGFLPCEMIFVGHSMGTGVAVDLAHSLEAIYRKTNEVGDKLYSLILLSPYASLAGIVQKNQCIVIGWGARCFMVNNLDSLKKIPEIDVHTLYLHGQTDDLIPPSDSLELAAAQVQTSPAHKTKIVSVQLVQGQDHHFFLKNAQVQAEIHEFIKKVKRWGSDLNTDEPEPAEY